MSFAEDFFQSALRLQTERISFVAVTLLKVEGHAPQNPGAKTIITREGLYWGTVGGGKVEARVIATAQELLKTEARDPHLVHWNLQKDIGMSCGGAVTFLFEPFGTRPWKIAVFGAGHVAQALVPLLATLNCEVTCLDPRQEWIRKLETLHRVQLKCATDLPAEVKALDAKSYFVVMTQGHTTDLPVLDQILRNFPEARYIGVLGSEVKAMKIRKDLEELGHRPELVRQVRCPMGLPLGSNSPAEMGVSIAAELIQVRDQFA